MHDRVRETLTCMLRDRGFNCDGDFDEENQLWCVHGSLPCWLSMVGPSWTWLASWEKVEAAGAPS